MNEQNESLLFRLPRELRDEIYHYYVLEEDGYHHDATSDKLRQASGRPINLSLQYTCKKTATEMEGLALQVNRVTFRTKLDVPEPGSEFSNALLWNHLLRKRERPLRRMFERSYTLVTLEAIRRLRELHPESTAAEQLEKVFIRMGDRRHWLSSGTLLIEGIVWSIDYTAHTTLLQDLLQILSTHPEFWRLTSKEYTRESEANDCRHASASQIEPFPDFAQTIGLYTKIWSTQIRRFRRGCLDGARTHGECRIALSLTRFSNSFHGRLQ